MLFTNIKSLAGILTSDKKVLRGTELSELKTIENAWLLTENGLIKDFGAMSVLPALPNEQVTDVSGQFILPAWCDSHTHIVFAASREEEFVMKIKGSTYEEIAAAGGGILNSAQKLQETTEEVLYASAAARLNTMILNGTGAVEIKSGYGLTVASELKMLRVIKRLKQEFPIPVKATFLAAHTYPPAYKNNHQGYIKLIIEEMLPIVAAEGLADFMDVFCEQGFFSNEETDLLLTAGIKYGLRPKIHVNQLSISGGVQVGVKNNALSVDHLEETDAAAIKCLADSNTVGTLLPGCSFYLGIPFANARAMLNAGAAISIASDYNPGSAPSGNMNFVVSLGCIKLKLLPQEAINAATINGAAAMDLSQEIGSITKGKKANFILTQRMPSLDFFPYNFGGNLIDKVFINGKHYNGLL